MTLTHPNSPEEVERVDRLMDKIDRWDCVIVHTEEGEFGPFYTDDIESMEAADFRAIGEHTSAATDDMKHNEADFTLEYYKGISDPDAHATVTLYGENTDDVVGCYNIEDITEVKIL